LFNPVEPMEDFLSPKVSKRVSSEPEDRVTSFDAELLGNKIVKSEVEREFIQALKAVR
jgi:hypothetical protein